MESISNVLREGIAVLLPYSRVLAARVPSVSWCEIVVPFFALPEEVVFRESELGSLIREAITISEEIGHSCESELALGGSWVGDLR